MPTDLLRGRAQPTAGPANANAWRPFRARARRLTARVSPVRPSAGSTDPRPPGPSTLHAGVPAPPPGPPRGSHLRAWLPSQSSEASQGGPGAVAAAPALDPVGWDQGRVKALAKGSWGSGAQRPSGHGQVHENVTRLLHKVTREAEVFPT